MVDVIDTNQNFTVTLLSAPPSGEGFGEIMPNSLVAPNQLKQGESFDVFIDVLNDSNNDDTIFLKLIDADTGQVLKRIQASIKSKSAWYPEILGITMPNKNFNLMIQAGHVE